MEFSEESEARLGEWWERSGDPELLDCVAEVMQLIDDDAWNRLHFDEFHVQAGWRRRIRSSAPGLIVTVDIVVDEGRQLADLVSVYELEHDDDELGAWRIP